MKSIKGDDSFSPKLGLLTSSDAPVLVLYLGDGSS